MIIQLRVPPPQTFRFTIENVAGQSSSAVDLTDDSVSAQLFEPGGATSFRACTVVDADAGIVDVDMADVAWALGTYILSFTVTLDGVMESWGNVDIHVQTPKPTRRVRSHTPYLI